MPSDAGRVKLIYTPDQITYDGCNMRKEISVAQVERGIYIDFEGTAVDDPSFMGIYYTPDNSAPVFLQPVFEEGLHSAAAIKPTGNIHPIPAEFKSTMKTLQDLCTQEDRLVFTYSSFEHAMISQIDERLGNRLELNPLLERVVDVKPYAKKWKRQFHPNVEFEKTDRRGKYTLGQFLRLIEYEVPSLYGTGNSARRIRDVRHQLAKRDFDYANLTAVAKRKWNSALQHNWYDCNGLRFLMMQIATDSA